jgi:hypothetical protein
MAMLVCALLLFSTNADATHFRGGNLTWQRKTNDSIKYTVNTSWRRGFFFTGTSPVVGMTANVGSFTFGDGTSTSIIATVVSEDLAGDVINTTWTVTKKYTTAGFYVANALNSGNRVCPKRTISCNGDFYNLQTRVQIGGGATNSSAVSSFPTFINLPINAPAATFTIPATDPDGDPVRFRLARTGSPSPTSGSTVDTNRESGLVTAAAPNMTLSSSGVVTMNTNGRSVDTQYSIQVMVEDYNASTGAVKSKIPVDFLIRMVAASSPPFFTSPTTVNYTVPIGTPLSFVVSAGTSDAARTVTLASVSIPSGSSMSPSLPVSGSVGGSVSSTFSWTPNSSQTGSYVITFVAQNDLGLQVFKTINITVPCALDFTSSVTNTTCNGGTNGAVSNTISNFSSTGNLSYSWSGPGGFTATTKDISSVAAGNYTFSVNDAGTACVRTKAVVIGEPAAISFTATATQPTCSYNTGSVSLSTPTGGTGTITFNSTPTTGLTTGSYTYTATDANGCTASQTVTITNPAADPAITGNANVCLGLTTALSNATAGGTWSSGSPSVATVNATTGVVTGHTLGTATITYTLSTGCIVTRVVTVSPLPVAQLVTGGGAYCAGGSGVAIGVQNTQSGVSYQLYNGATAVGSPQTGSGPSISFGMHTVAGTYSVVGTTATGCSANMSNTVTVVINPIPTVTVPSNQSVCAGSTQGALAFSGSVSGTSFSWTNNNPSIGLGAGGTGTVCGTVNEHGSVTLTAPTGSVFTSVNFASYGLPNGSCGSFTIGSCHASNSMSVVQSLLLGQNSATILAENSVFTDPCFGTFKRLYIEATYTSTGNIPAFTATNSGSSPITGTVTVTPTANGCSGTPGTFTITVNPKPTVYSVNGGGSYCSGGSGVSVGLSNSQTGVDYQLMLGSSPIGSAVAGTGSAITFGSQTTAGTYTVVATNATTSCSSNMSGSATVSINTAPTVSCSGNVSVNNSAGNCNAVVTYSSATATGTPTPSITYSHTSGSTFNVGTTNVTVTATNTCGTATCNFDVIVNDNENPHAICQNKTVYLSDVSTGGTASISVSDINNGSWDNCGLGTLSLSNTSFSCSNVGSSNTVTLTVPDVNGNSSSCTATITVVDNSAPHAICQNKTVYLSDVSTGGTASISVSDIDNGSWDNCGLGTLSLSNTSFSCSNVGSSNTVTLTVPDVNGNSSSCTATITVVDNSAPHTICQNKTVYLSDVSTGGTASISVSDINNGSWDNCGLGTLSLSNTSFNCSNVGSSNTVTLTVPDVNGNSSTCTATITVVDDAAPHAFCQNKTVYLSDVSTGGTASISVSDINNGSWDNCSLGTLSLSNTSFGCTNVGSSNTVTLTVPDVNGNSSTCTATVTVIDNSVPHAICQNKTVYLSDASSGTGSISISVSDVNNGSWDNCGIASTSLSNYSYSCSNLGANTVTLTVTDVHSLTATCTATVTVVDNSAPHAICKNKTVYLSDASSGTGSASITVSDINNGSWDNCTLGTLSLNTTSFSCSNLGANTVTLTVPDVNGNSATCTATVTVVDNSAPHVSCKNYTLNLSGGTGTVTGSNIDNGSWDNCSIASMTVSPNTFTCANAGANTVTLTVTDGSGNSASCTATVTVQYQPSCTISITPSSSTYTGGIDNNIYLGYGSQSATITANATGGSGFTYSWSPSTRLSSSTAQSPVFTPTASGTYTYTVTATNSNGCSTTCTVSFCVVDARDPSHSNKVILCHIPPGNPSNPQQLSISSSAVSAHLTGHTGDHLGPCWGGCGTGPKFGGQPVAEEHSHEFKVYPNPTEGMINVVIPDIYTSAEITIMDVTGRVVGQKSVTDNKGEVNQFDLGGVARGVYLVRINAGDDAHNVKVIVR